MVDLASANVTITVQKQRVEGKVRRNTVKIVFGDGALTYPANGVPMPSRGSFGMKQSLDSLMLVDNANADGLLYKYDYVNKKIRIWYPTQQTAGAGNRAGIELTGGSTAVAATTLYAEAVGS